LKETGVHVEYEVSPKILFNYIQKHILESMVAGGIQFSVFCIKVRWEMTPAKMQEYSNLNPEVGQHFVVLYSVRTLPFLKSSQLAEENGRQYITDKGVRRKRYVHGAVKGEFHWIVLKNTKYTYAQDVRSWWYKKWIEYKNTPVYVKEIFIKIFPSPPSSLTHVHRCIGCRNATRQTLPTPVKLTSLSIYDNRSVTTQCM
jgi:hypothetical protein